MIKTGWIGSEHVTFLPCRKLKYRGILFVSVDFYSENRVDINTERIAEAFIVAKKYNCRKLSCPENFLYENFESEPCIEQLFSQVAKVVSQLQKEDQKIDFMIDIIIRNTFFNYLRFRSDKKYYDFSKTFLELLPKCSEILPWYRKRIKHNYRANALNNKDAKNVRKILTAQNISIKKVLKVEKRLHKALGDYEGCPEFQQFLLWMLEEMPWNYDLITERFK